MLSIGTNKTTKRRVLVETENESAVSFEYIWPGMGAKAHRPNMSPPDRNRNPCKSPPTNFSSFFLISIMSPFVGTTLGHPSHYLFTCFLRSVCLSVSYSAPHEMAAFASESYSSSWYSTTVFVSLYQPPLHIKWQFFPLSVMLNTIQDGSVRVCPLLFVPFLCLFLSLWPCQLYFSP